MARVFLSYARDDCDRVRSLAAVLEQDGHSVWWDQHIRGGHRFGDEIEKALTAADVVVVAWSKTSVKSAWVCDEAATGRDNGRLVPVSLDGTGPPLGFRQFQTIDLSGWTGSRRSKLLVPLLQAIAERAGGEGEGDKPSEPQFERQGSGLGGLPAKALAAAAAIAILAGAALFAAFSPKSASAGVIPSVALGEFAAASDDVPPELLRAIRDEMLSAFGSEHEVTLVTNDGGSAHFLLDGSAQKTPDSLRFSVNLTNSQTGGVVWSQAFDRAPEDTLAARQVAVAATQIVRCGIWGAASYGKPMTDRSLSLYIQWCNEYWGGSPDEDRILDAARRVSAAAPDFSYAWSALALSAVPISHRAGYAEAPAIAREGWNAAEKAIQLNPDNPEGYMAQAGLLPTEKFAEREQLLEKAIKARPTECGCERQAYGDFLMAVGRNAEAVTQYDRARAMMPLAPMSNARLAQALYLAGRSQEADEIVKSTLDLWPDAEIIRVLELKSALWTRRYAEAASLLEGPELHLPDAEREALLQSFEALRAGDSGKISKAAARLSEIAADPRTNDRLIVATLAALDARAAALEAAGALIRSRGPALADVLFESNLAEAAGTPQYSALVERLGLAGYWRSSGRAPDVCSSATRPAFCNSKKRG